MLPGKTVARPCCVQNEMKLEVDGFTRLPLRDTNCLTTIGPWRSNFRMKAEESLLIDHELQTKRSLSTAAQRVSIYGHNLCRSVGRYLIVCCVVCDLCLCFCSRVAKAMSPAAPSLDTHTLRSFRSMPFIFSMARSAASCVSKCTNAYPLEPFSSHTTCQKNIRTLGLLPHANPCTFTTDLPSPTTRS